MIGIAVGLPLEIGHEEDVDMRSDRLCELHRHLQRLLGMQRAVHRHEELHLILHLGTSFHHGLSFYLYSS